MLEASREQWKGLSKLTIEDRPGSQGRQKLNKKMEVEKNRKLLEKRVEKKNSLESVPNIIELSQLHVVKSQKYCIL
jgi:hypothetical protein